MTIEVRPIVEAELERYMELCQIGFGGKPEDGEGERIRAVLGLDRTFAAFDGTRMVGTEGAYGLRLTVPGTGDGSNDETEPETAAEPAGVPTAGLTRVTVAATDRRRGVLTAMMAAHFADAAEHGEPLSGLWASELPIYGRFGYGPASDAIRISYDARQAGLRAPDRPDDVAFADGDEAALVLPALRERDRLTRPGHYHRSEAWWTHRSFADHEYWRNGASPRRTVIARREGEPVGYATFRHAPRWTDHDLPDGEIRVIDAVGVDLRARHTLWWFLSNIDLHPRVAFWSLPIDCELPWLAANQRAIVRHVTDGLQLRVLDVVAAPRGQGVERAGDPGVRDGRSAPSPGRRHLPPDGGRRRGGPGRPDRRRAGAPAPTGRPGSAVPRRPFARAAGRGRVVGRRGRGQAAGRAPLRLAGGGLVRRDVLTGRRALAERWRSPSPRRPSPPG